MNGTQSELTVEAFSLLAGDARAKFVQDFSTLPRRVRKETFTTGLLPDEVWQRFLLMPLSFKREFWFVRDARGEVVGRIGANLAATRAEQGNIGFFELDLSAVSFRTAGQVLLEAATTWLRSVGAKEIFGPINFNTWFPYRFQDTAPAGKSPVFAWEPVNPPEYARVWQENGFKEVERYKSQGFANLPELLEITRRDFDKASALGVTFRAFDQARLLEQEVPILYALSMEGFRSAFLFEPITLDSFKELYLPIAGKKMNLASFFALDKEGKEVGFFFCFVDQGYLVLKTVTVADRARGQGISNALVHMAAKEALRLGSDKFITALVRCGAQSESYTKKTPELWKHEYVLFSLG